MSECQGKAPEPAPVVEPEPDPEPEQPKATGNGGTLLLVLAVVFIGGGAGWYFKIYRPKKQQAADVPEEDYGGEYDGAGGLMTKPLPRTMGRLGTRMIPKARIMNEIYQQPL